MGGTDEEMVRAPTAAATDQEVDEERTLSTTAEVRAWAQANGYAVGKNGRIAGEVWKAYDQARLDVLQEGIDSPVIFTDMSEPEYDEALNERAEADRARRAEFEAAVLLVAEKLSFNVGNAILAAVEGDLNVAIEALLREHRRLYPAVDPSTKEN